MSVPTRDEMIGPGIDVLRAEGVDDVGDPPTSKTDVELACSNHSPKASSFELIVFAWYQCGPFT